MSTDISSALGVGSGIDIKALAENLTKVEREPREQAIQTRIDKTEKRISGYGAVMFGLKQLKDAFSALNDKTDFTGATVRNSAPLAFDAVASAGASVAQHSVEVISLAQSQISRSGNFAAADSTLNNGASFSLTITSAGKATNVSVTERTPAGIVDAINSKQGLTGVEARLVNTGDPANPYTIVLTGQSGLANSFTVAQPAGEAPVAGLSFATRLQTAEDSQAVIDGITIFRDTNTLDDVIPGIKFELLSRTTTPGTVSVTRDTAPVKAKIEALAKAYNDLQDFLDTLGDPDSTDEEYGGVLQNDSTIRYVREQARSMITASSTTPGTTVAALRDIGITLDRSGRLQTDAAKLDVSMLARFDDIAEAFGANAVYSSTSSSTTPRGLAGDALRRLDAMMANDGPILSRNEQATRQLQDAEEDMADLKVRMDGVYERYLKQLSVMDGVVSQMNALRESLKGQFENLAAAYNNK